ncbi:ATP-binding protein [Hyalangium versicolor]|uniref:ATP-binding protein n=1 Tax=Hyalangium versicolor TaxID=2861190 RepID=UPI001CCF6F86|nr:ATP-binding protein [Hyalangium versicolor]
MSQIPYSPGALRTLIETFRNPMVVVRERAMWLVNEPFLRLVGLSREQVEGRPALDFVNPDEHGRLSARFQLMLDGEIPFPNDVVRRLIPSSDGRMHDMATYIQQVALEGGERGFLVNYLELVERPPAVIVAERLVETSARLVGVHSEEEVVLVATEGLASAGFRARFLRWDGKELFAQDGTLLAEEMKLAAEALGEGRAIYGGVETSEATHVYLPLGDARNGVLWVEGQGIDPTNGSTLALFAKVVGTAFSEARVEAERMRGQWELRVLAAVARFVAQPVPPTPESFIEKLVGLLSADAALLMLREEPEAPLVLSAQVGLAELRKVADSLGAILGDTAVKVEQGRLSTQAEEQALREASGGRFGSGAAVRITRGGQVHGTLQLFRAPGRPFQEADLRLLGTVIELLTTLLEQHRLRAEAARQLSETRLLLELARTTAGVLDSAGILDVAADFLVRLLDVSNCHIMVYDEQAKVLRGAAGSAAHREFLRGLVLPLDSDTLSSRVARERRPLFIEDVDKVPGGGYSPELARRFKAKAILGLPLTSRDELIGVVTVDDTRGPRAFGPALIELAEATCGQIALSIANARLYESLWGSYAELAAARAEMVKRERLAALGELSAIVAHEVRNPLGVIFNAVTSLRRLLKVEGDPAMLLDILSEESDRLNRIVADLLDFTRPRDPILQPEDMGRVLQDAIEAARAQGGSDAQTVNFVAEVEPHLPPARMDRRLIRQALINVLVNALQSMPQGGVVTVRARRELHGGRDWLRSDVSDQGMGIPSELLHRVFEPFFTTKAQGTGLGLAVVRRILDEHGGEITVESTPGRGTTFIIRLPLLPPTLP